ncbi:MAG: putative ABC transporter permease [Bacillales bacterium]|nr:putative ABC transporter permease [Bacillales bacterium]
MEVVLKSKDEHKFVNRGFLIGPICPIYGFGVLLIILLVGNSKSDLLAVFLKSILVCSVLEYFTSYFMEKLFHARWWDYSKNKYNINGRICLETMLPFGILSTIVIYVVHPLVIKFVSLFSNTLLIILTILFGILFIVDNIVSFNVMFNIKKEFHKIKKDNTDYIKGKVSKWLEENTYLYKRIRYAFPNFKIKNIIKKMS